MQLRWILAFVAFVPVILSRRSASAAEVVGLKVEDAQTLVLEVRADAGSVALPLEAASFSINGEKVTALGRHSATIYEGKHGRGGDLDYPQIVLHRFFLRMATRLKEGETYVIQSPFERAQMKFSARGALCEAIKFNQVGYNPASRRRYAFYAPWSGDLPAEPGAEPSEFEILSAVGREPVAKGMLERCDPDPRVGGPVWRIDLSNIPGPGQFVISVSGVGCSEPFGVDDADAQHSFYTHMKGVYHQRCGVALVEPYTKWTRPACHTELTITEAEPPDFIRVNGTSKLKHEGGGHHDAGDFDIRLVHTVVPGYLLNAFELFPEKFIDGQLDIPESGNGIPDLLDEALFGIRAWEVLQAEDGSIRAGWEADRHPTYGEVTAATDKLGYRTYRAIGHTTLEGGALMAYAARLVRPFDAKRADELVDRARRAWGFYAGNRENPKFAWTAGARLYAACQLYLATGEAAFHAEMREPAELVFGLNGRKSKWPAEYKGHLANLNYVNEGMVFTHFFAGYLLEPKLAKDAELEKPMKAAVLRQADEILRATEQKGFVIYKLGDWGMSTATGRYADYLLNAFRLTGEQRYYDGASLLADWQLGANPAGRCFTSGLGYRPPYNPLHLDSFDTIRRGLGPVPGIPIYGITQTLNAPPYVKAVTQHLYPAFEKLPEARRYTDGWSVVMQNEFTVWETMAPSAFLHACLAPKTPIKGDRLPMGEIRIPGGYPRN
jgi:endoglucanase